MPVLVGEIEVDVAGVLRGADVDYPFRAVELRPCFKQVERRPDLRCTRRLPGRLVIGSAAGTRESACCGWARFLGDRRS